MAKIGNTGESTNFQNELDNVVYPWATNNNMYLNSDNFEHQRIQGTVLGLILFIIMICDLDRDLLYSIVSKYADDTKNTAKFVTLITR